MFGYFPRSIADGRTIPYATREKALLDLLYLLYPFYNIESELLQLRLDSETARRSDLRNHLKSYTKIPQINQVQALEGPSRIQSDP